MVGNQQFGEGFPPIRRPSAIVPRPPPRRSLGRTCQDKLRPSGIPSGQRHPSCSRRGRFLPGRRVEMRRASSQSRKGLSSRWSTNTAKPARLGFTDIRPLPVREPRRYYGVPIPFTPGRWSFDKRPVLFAGDCGDHAHRLLRYPATCDAIGTPSRNALLHSRAPSPRSHSRESMARGPRSDTASSAEPSAMGTTGPGVGRKRFQLKAGRFGSKPRATSVLTLSTSVLITRVSTGARPVSPEGGPGS